MSDISVDFSGPPKILKATHTSEYLLCQRHNYQNQCKQIFLKNKQNKINTNLLWSIFQCRGKDIILQSSMLQLVLKSLDINYLLFLKLVMKTCQYKSFLMKKLHVYYEAFFLVSG